MRKEYILPAVAAAGGVVGFGLRRWELATAFEPDTGLPIPGTSATLALVLFCAVMALVLALLCRGRYNSFPGGYDQAFAAKGNTLYVTVMVLSAFLLLAAAVLDVSAFLRREHTVLTRLIVDVLAVASCACVIVTARSSFKGEARGKYNFALLMPAYTCCVWLIAAYQVRAGDPVQLDYIYELLAIIAALLGLYFTAGFSFERGKPFRAALFSLLGVYFSIVTLADTHDLATTLLYGFVILHLLARAAVLLHNAAQPEDESQAPGGDATDQQTEGTSDEP